MISEGRLTHRTLISLDAHWYHVLELGGEEFRGSDSWSDCLVPKLERRVRSRLCIQQLVVKYG